MDIDLCLVVDSWACTQLIMPLLFQDDKSWIQAASTRQEVPAEIMGSITSERYHYNRGFCSYLMSPYFPNSTSDMSNVLISNWMSDSFDIQTYIFQQLLNTLCFCISTNKNRFKNVKILSISNTPGATAAHTHLDCKSLQ